MIKRITTLLISVLLASQVFAGGISEQNAHKVAKAFMHSNALSNAGVSFESLETLPALVLSSNTPLLYAVNFAKGGFVLVSATDAAYPVVGYSPAGSFSMQNQSPSLIGWMAGYELQLQEIIDQQLQATVEIELAWNDLLNYDPDKSASGRNNRQVEPLLPCTWNQGALYNDLCPEDNGGPGGHVYSGCVATAMSQVIYYWRYPLQGTGTHGYYSSYGYLYVDFADVAYNYEEMRNSIGGESNYEMAEIQYHCGITVDMMYSASGSGAYSHDAAEALRSHFGFSNDLSLEYKDNYSTAAWASLLQQNLDNGWPMYYHGFGSGGHAFNVDGYQGDDFFHFNWGWGGSANGYFYLNNLNPNGSNFTSGQGAIVNFVPAGNYPYYCDGVKTLTRHNGTIEDGSGPVDGYISGLECGWLIAPMDSVTNLTVNFEKFGLTDGEDVLNIFDGPDASFPLLGSYTGNALPPSVTASGDKMYLEFLTSGDQGSGFRLSYNSERAVYCSGQTVLNDATGIIADGSGTRDYNNNSVCKFRIEPEDAASITFTFNYLNTEPVNDAIKIYNLASQTMVGNFSGSDNPGSITVPSGKALILFTTNSSVTAQGWEISYTSSTSAVATEFESADKLKVNVFPVPASQWLRVELSNRVSAEVTLSIHDLSGRKVADNSLVKLEGQKTVMIPVHTLSDGIYYLRYISESGSGVRKVMIRN
jgi:hypothetical protein